MRKRVFVLSCNPTVRDLCRQYLDLYIVDFCGTWKRFRECVSKICPKLILIDYSFLLTTDPCLLEEFCTPNQSIPLVLLTLSDCSFFFRWFDKLGIKHIVYLPCDKKKFEQVILSALNVQSFFSEITLEEIPSCPVLDQLLGTSAKMKELKTSVYLFAQTDSPLLLTGESGTGKTHLARIIHNLSSRSHNYFCAVNMASIPASLSEAELFGTVKGAYTGAITRDGYFSSARGGTLFLDEIGELPLTIQPKLLRVLEANRYNKVGSTKEEHCNTRFIFATNADLCFLVEKGLFRRDLFHRISILPIEVPPLRDRKTDIPQLVQHFLKPYKKDISSTCIQKLMDYHWPGNVRELKNCLERASVLTPKEMIHDGHISFQFSSSY